MRFRIWKQKPWRDSILRWRIVSPEFPDRLSLREAILELLARKDDGAKCIIMPSFR